MDSSVTVGGGLVLSCAVQGDPGGPVVVLLHGPTDSWRSYGPVLGHLPAWARTVAVSQRGHGDSGKPEHGYRVEDFAADVVDLLDALDVGRAVLVAHSGSCLTARRVALDHPGRVRGLVLEASPSTLRGDPGLNGFVETAMSGLADPVDPSFARSFVTDTSAAGVAAELVSVLVAEACKVPARVWRETFADLLAYDDRDELARLTVPTLLVWGDQDPLVARSAQDELLGRLPDAALTTYAGLGHTPRWEDPARFAADVAAFVERCR